MLLILWNAERRNLTESIVMDRIVVSFACRSIVVAKEMREEGGYNFHVGILNRDASRYTANKLFQEMFPEFDEDDIETKNTTTGGGRSVLI